jgi:predicted MFS family arabinose efflux permease
MAKAAVSSPAERASAPARPWVIALAGMLALAAAMGIGRFAFTPLLPMMLADGVLDLPSASWLASANYFGYMVGALLCVAQPFVWARWRSLPAVSATAFVRGGLVATTLLTLGMALHLPPAWPALRFLAGVASAVVFVFTSGWCLARLARLGVPSLGGVIYAGPGVGIAVSGLSATAMVSAQWSAATGWVIFGVLAAVLGAIVWPVVQGADELRTAGPASAAPSRHGPAELGVLTLAYGLAGFGYIITATFLPVIARTTLPGSVWLDLFWPIFGIGVATGALLATRIPPRFDFRHLLAAGYFMQAFGVMLGVWLPNLAGFALGSLLVGLPFTAITFFAMQEVRRLRPPAFVASFMGLMTAAYGIGQIAGPPLVAALLARSTSQAHGFTLSLEVAALSLVFGAGMYLWLARLHPVGAPSR